MSFLNNIKISVKLPLIMLSLSAIALIGMGVMAYYNAKSTLDEAGRTRMQIALQTRAASVFTWHKNLSKEVIAQSSTPSTRRAVTEFIGAWAALPGDKTDYLKEHFEAPTTNDGDTAGVVDFSVVQTDYSRRHRRRHPYYQTVLERNSYTDIFLFDPEGNLIYSVAKEADYATNFVTGALKDTGLATAYQQAMTLGANETAFVDLAPYAPSNGDVAGFVAAPILAVNGAVLGVYAIQISTESVKTVFDSDAGMGESGITMAVGPDYHPRLSSEDANADEFATITVDPGLVDRAMSGASGMAYGVGQNGQDVLAAYAPLHLGDLTWAMISEQDTDELFAPAVLLRNAVSCRSRHSWTASQSRLRPLSAARSATYWATGGLTRSGS